MHPGTTVRRDCLERNRLSVTDAARILGVDRQTLSNLLNARSGMIGDWPGGMTRTVRPQGIYPAYSPDLKRNSVKCEHH